MDKYPSLALLSSKLALIPASRIAFLGQFISFAVCKYTHISTSQNSEVQFIKWYQALLQGGLPKSEFQLCTLNIGLPTSRSASVAVAAAFFYSIQRIMYFPPGIQKLQLLVPACQIAVKGIIARVSGKYWQPLLNISQLTGGVRLGAKDGIAALIQHRKYHTCCGIFVNSPVIVPVFKKTQHLLGCHLPPFPFSSFVYEKYLFSLSPSPHRAYLLLY